MQSGMIRDCHLFFSNFTIKRELIIVHLTMRRKLRTFYEIIKMNVTCYIDQLGNCSLFSNNVSLSVLKLHSL